MWVWEAFYLEDPCELTFANTLLLSNAAISLGNAFINLEISSEYIIFFTLWSFFLSSLFISLQIKEFRILALSINDSLYSSLFFFLTGLHFFHLSIGLILLIYFWGRSPCRPSSPLVTRTVRLSSLYVHPFALRSVSLGTALRARNGRGTGIRTQVQVIFHNRNHVLEFLLRNLWCVILIITTLLTSFHYIWFIIRITLHNELISLIMTKR